MVEVDLPTKPVNLFVLHESVPDQAEVVVQKHQDIVANCASTLVARSSEYAMHILIAVVDPIFVAGFIALGSQVDQHSLDTRKCRGDSVLVALELIAVFATVDLVLDRDDKARLLAGDQEIDVPPLAANLDAAQVCTVELDRAHRWSEALVARLAEHVHEQRPEERVASAVAPAGRQQPLEEVAVSNLNPCYSECLKDVEATNLFFQ